MAYKFCKQHAQLNCFCALTFTEARRQVRAYGFSLKRTDAGEYRVGTGLEATSYYTDDLNDAVNTARAMRAELERMYL